MDDKQVYWIVLKLEQNISYKQYGGAALCGLYGGFELCGYFVTFKILKNAKSKYLRPSFRGNRKRNW